MLHTSRVNTKRRVRLRFNLVLTTRELAQEGNWNAFVFTSPRPVEARTLAKLAPINDPSLAHIGVGPQNTGEVRAWGLFQHRRFDNFHEGFVCPFVQIFGPGHLAVTMGRSTVFLYQRGEVRWEDHHLSNRINSVVAPLIRFSELREIGRHIKIHGHGGAFFLVPAFDENVRRVLDGDPYWASESGWSQWAKEKEKNRTSNMPIDPDDELLTGPCADSYAFIGRLSSVDGAVLATATGHVVAFGVFVGSPEKSRKPSLVDGSEKPLIVADVVKGARHRSAMWFCQSLPSAAALVVSQDGNITLFVKRLGHEPIVVERIV